TQFPRSGYTRTVGHACGDYQKAEIVSAIFRFEFRGPPGYGRKYRYWHIRPRSVLPADPWQRPESTKPYDHPLKRRVQVDCNRTLSCLPNWFFPRLSKLVPRFRGRP